jgi:hypothetical protein
MSAIASTQISDLDRIKLHFISGLIRSSQYLSDSPEERLRQRIDLNYLHASYINSAMPLFQSINTENAAITKINIQIAII